MRTWIGVWILIIVALFGMAFFPIEQEKPFSDLYLLRLNQFQASLKSAIQRIEQLRLLDEQGKLEAEIVLLKARKDMKRVDLFLRYFNPLIYKQINAPLPVEWETEVFEKFEKPYKRTGNGLSLALMYLDEENCIKDSLLHLITPALSASNWYSSDSLVQSFQDPSLFVYANRLYLLNLAAIYTTGFENPRPAAVIPELKYMLDSQMQFYTAFNQQNPDLAFDSKYLTLFSKTQEFLSTQSENLESFDHFTFIKSYVNPLFQLNQLMIQRIDKSSGQLVDYSLNDFAKSIFDKALYEGQNRLGVYSKATDLKDLRLIDSLGKMLFFDPLLSGNNRRACFSCHNSTQFFTENEVASHRNFDSINFLARNTPSLINADLNHLLMADGKHYNLQDQAKGVIQNGDEMNCSMDKALEKVLTCKTYTKGFKYLLKYTPQDKEVGAKHVVSALTAYYTKFSQYYSAFDSAMNNNNAVNASVSRGFNLFMGKAQCATCHFVPHFNGVKPPYVSSEFEVLGVPADKEFTQLSPDLGRYKVLQADEAHRAFRTGTLKNIAKTSPYMHNGVFKDLNEVIDFYDAGGGIGHGFVLNNQTLSADSLHLTADDKKDLVAFMNSLTEAVPSESIPKSLPYSKQQDLNIRKVGGIY